MNSAWNQDSSDDFNGEKNSNWICRWKEMFREEVEWLPVAV